MNCARWNDSLIGRLYGEISTEDDAALEQHLSLCSSCRETLEEFGRIRSVLAADEPAVPRLPRVVVLRGSPRWRSAAIAASILGAALLAGTGAGAGYALGARRQAPPAAVATQLPAELDPVTESLIRQEIDRRVASMRAQAAPAEPTPAREGVTPQELQAQLARFERKINDSRASDLDYLLTQIEASEVRSGTRIGKTNEALRTVALASNPYIGSE
jgi:hypothetical protein